MRAPLRDEDIGGSGRAVARLELGRELVPARLVGRSGRFSVDAEIDGPRGKECVRAYLPNSGRLTEVLQPGAEARLRRATGTGRALPYTLVAARTSGGVWVSVDAGAPNALFRHALAAGAYPEFAGLTARSEVRYGDSRIDFALYAEDGDRRGELRGLIEVKSCTLVGPDGLARFPDAPTARGTRHLAELVRAVGDGLLAAVVFVIQRSDAVGFAPNDEVDAAFGGMLRRARATGVRVIACRCTVTPEAVLAYDRRVPVRLEEARR